MTTFSIDTEIRALKIFVGAIEEMDGRARRAERRASAYRNLLLEIAEAEDGCLGLPYGQLIANLDKLLAQEEAQEKK